MNFHYRDLGHRSRGEILEVILQGNAANVRLMDSANFSKFKRNKSGQYYGGLARRSPVRLQIPHYGHWYATLNFGGYKGSTRWGVSILPGLLPAIRESSLSSMPSLLHDMTPAHGTEEPDQDTKIYDVFVSHASEDKDDVVRDLAHALQAEGLAVWYDEFELRIGDSLRRKIDRGLANSRFGVVVLSPAFFGRGGQNMDWTGSSPRELAKSKSFFPFGTT